MSKASPGAVRDYRARQRARGMRPIQRWLPDTRTPEFAAQVEHAIAVLKAAEEPASREEREMWDAWDRAGVEDWPEWTGPDLSKAEDQA